MIVYACIGNSDDRLTQWEWHEFAAAFMGLVSGATGTVHGEWFSAPIAPYQSACVCFEIAPDEAEPLKRALAELARQYRQDSIAWAAVEGTQFL